MSKTHFHSNKKFDKIVDKDAGQKMRTKEKRKTRTNTENSRDKQIELQTKCIFY